MAEGLSASVLMRGKELKENGNVDVDKEDRIGGESLTVTGSSGGMVPLGGTLRGPWPGSSRAVQVSLLGA